MSKQSPLVPSQQLGASSDTEHSITKETRNEAVAFFKKVHHRLLDVNNWDNLCGPASADFRLTDQNGNEVKRNAQLGDHLKINIPGPGPLTGEGYDWVKIEAIEDHSNELAEEERVAIRVRPSDNPQKTEDDVAHFFSDEASSTFAVYRKANTITASVQGRNEKPNTETDKLIDKARNIVVGVGAIIGLNKLQWNSLVKGLLAE